MQIKGKDLTQKQAGQLFTDVRKFFHELFTEHPDLEEVVRPPETLRSDLQARFGKQYDPDMLLKLLANGYQQQHGGYVFKRDDFFPWKRPVLDQQEQEGQP